ncbi:ATP-binding protein [Mesorhizobium sp. LMG17149]
MFNVLDNALEASPLWVGLIVSRHADDLIVEVVDSGPGFEEAMLAEFGKPYTSTKNRPGSGLGLFLVVNVIRKLGGTVTVRNRTEGGASVTLHLPLAALSARGHNAD